MSVAGFTSIEKGAKLTTFTPSLTEMIMFAYVPLESFGGIPKVALWWH